ncbi:MAG: dihydroorotase [Chloroflexota bacterium]|nr:dihydroorotase [Chloroflexota bacterium]MXX48314.1 dihydroorotase [Chloroflexota bacterium]
MNRILVYGGRVIDPASGIDERLDVLVVDGRIAEVGADLAAPEGADLLAASGLVVAPGFVDLHTHLREPGQEHKETIASGARAAARGGFTTICAMPNTEPALDSAAIIDGMLQRAQDVDCRVLPIGAVSKARAGKELTEFSALRDAGAVAVSDDGDAVADTSLARRAFEYLADLDIPLAEHCEDPAIAQGGVMHDGAVSARLGLRGQPAAAELSIVQRDIALAEAAGAQFHACHISTEPSLQAIADARARGLHVTAEVTPHHLYLTHDVVAGSSDELLYDTNAKVNPPLRTDTDVQACIDALAAGVVDAVATDHAPHAAIDKQCEFDAAAFGISGLESAWGVVNSLVIAGRLTLSDAIERLTIGPVRAWNLDQGALIGLGTLQVGAPADLTLLSTDAVSRVQPASWASKGKNTPLDGHSLIGLVAATISQGRIVWDGREQ